MCLNGVLGMLEAQDKSFTVPEVAVESSKARALAFYLSAETLAVELGGIPEGVSAALFSSWLESVRPIPYSTGLYTLVYEMLPEYNACKLLEAFGGEEEFSRVLEACVIEPQDDVMEEALTEYIEARLMVAFERIAQDYIGVVEAVLQELCAKGASRRKALTSVIAHLINKLLVEYGL